jgi:uncharacterized protein (UPF0332 family)
MSAPLVVLSSAMRKLPDARLLRISKATKDQLAAWLQGSNIEAAAGIPVNDLTLTVTTHRYRLALLHLSQGNKLLSGKRPAYRGSISRYYYALYNGFRACAYVFHHGDDHEKHITLPQHIPPDFPNSSQWQNALKDAREMRNRADYDPYPRHQGSFKSDALQLKRDATVSMPLVKAYLRNKGCTLTTCRQQVQGICRSSWRNR